MQKMADPIKSKPSTPPTTPPTMAPTLLDFWESDPSPAAAPAVAEADAPDDAAGEDEELKDVVLALAEEMKVTVVEVEVGTDADDSG